MSKDQTPVAASAAAGGGAGMSRRRFLGTSAGLAVGVAGASLLAGCGGGSSGRSTGSTLRVGLDTAGAASTLDPDVGAQFLADTARYSNVYSRITEYDDDFVLRNVVAEELTPNHTDHSWTLRIRPDLEFHNGKTMTADDIIYTIRRHGDESSVNSKQLAAVELAGLRKLDSRTVWIPMNRPFSTLPMAFARYAGLVLPSDFDIRNPVGSGPFRVTSFVPGQETRMERFGNYAFGVAKVDNVEIVEFRDPAAKLNALLSLQVDAINGVTPSQLAAVRASDNLTPLITDGGSWAPLCMNLSSKTFQDRRVAQAFRLMADRQMMVDIAYGGQGVVANDVYGRFDPSYIGDKIPQRGQDITEARRLLKQAGQSNMSVDLQTSDFAPGVVAAATIFAEQAAAAGVKVNVVKMSGTEFFGPRWLSDTFYSGFWPAADYFYPATATSLPDSPYNETHFNDPEWTSIYRRALAEYDQTKRDELFSECQRIDHERGGYIVWGFSNLVDAASTRTTGWPTGRFSSSLSNWQFSKVSLN